MKWTNECLLSQLEKNITIYLSWFISVHEGLVHGFVMKRTIAF